MIVYVRHLDSPISISTQYKPYPVIKIPPSCLVSFKALNEFICERLRYARKGYFFFRHRANGVLMAVVVHRNKVSYPESSFKGDNYPIWHYIVREEGWTPIKQKDRKAK